MHHAWNAIHGDFQWDRDLLFYLLGRDSRPLGDDLDVVVSHIRIRLHGEAVERDDAPDKKDHGHGQHENPVVERVIDNAANHFSFSYQGAWSRTTAAALS